jgi:hypothetical protein
MDSELKFAVVILVMVAAFLTFMLLMALGVSWLAVNIGG